MIYTTLPTKTLKILLNNQLDFNHLFVLTCLKRNSTDHLLFPASVYWLRTLESRDLTENHVLTESGEKLCKLLEVKVVNDENNEKNEKKIDVSDPFNIFWDLYPRTDKYAHWTASRALRVQKEKCRKKLYEILNKHEYSIEDIIKGLKAEISARQKSSHVKKENQLSFMVNSQTYLNNEYFIPWIDEDVSENFAPQRLDKLC